MDVLSQSHWGRKNGQTESELSLEKCDDRMNWKLEIARETNGHLRNGKWSTVVTTSNDDGPGNRFNQVTRGSDHLETDS